VRLLHDRRLLFGGSDVVSAGGDRNGGAHAARARDSMGKKSLLAVALSIAVATAALRAGDPGERPGAACNGHTGFLAGGADE
jgi:hypothetical protein